MVKKSQKKVKAKKLSIGKIVAIALAVSGVIGLIASFALSIETVSYIKNPHAALACNINPIVSCSSVIDTPQGQVFGFMNPLIGVVAFSMLIVFALSVWYDTKFPKFIWIGAEIASLLGVLFVHWLIYNSIYVLGSLCPYCMVTWTVTIATALYVSLRNVHEGLFGKNIKNKLDIFLQKNHLVILVIWYAVIFALIVNHFGLSSLFA